LDNISLFDRSAILPADGHIDQSDGTAWMGFYSLGMMRIALELAKENPVYQDLATKFFEHFISIAVAISGYHHEGSGLWDSVDGFFYDVLHFHNGNEQPLKVRSLVGLMPLIAVEILDEEVLGGMDVFKRRMGWFIKNRPHLTENMASIDLPGQKKRHLFSIVTKERLASICRYMLDETEFLSPHGIRSLSKIHETPYTLSLGNAHFSIGYEPAESQSGLFGGNSNWRGPIWFPINFLLIESLQRFHHFYGDEFQVELPTGSGNWVTLDVVADELSRRLIRLFKRSEGGKRPLYGGLSKFQDDPNWRDYILFYEYFHGDNGAGLGASHQTGWTGLVAKLLQDLK
ncbi:MAG: glucosidase, partial [Chloroflexota bacterium]